MHDLPRTIGFWRASGVMVGIIIGSGIFRTPVSIAAELSSPWLILALWGVGGLLALAGAVTYAEMATMYPRSGGVYVFLREAYGRGTAFVFGWTYLLITKPYAAAGIALIFGEHVNRLFGVGWDPRVTTISVLTACTLVNVVGMRLGSGVALALTAIKVGALAAIVVIGAALLPGSGRSLGGGAPGAVGDEGGSLLAALVPVMFGILWTYDGWSDVGAVAGEVKDPGRKLPRIYLAGTAAVILLYVAVNAVYMLYVPLAEMGSAAVQRSGTVAPLVTERLFAGIGLSAAAGGTAVTLVVLLSTLGSTHGSIITGARVSYAQARDGLLFSFLGRVHPRFGTPAASLWVQLVLSAAACWFVGSFEDLAAGFVFTMWIFYGLAAGAVFILRVRRPGAERPYRCPGYPVVPAVFVGVAAGMTALSVAHEPRMTLPWVGVLVAGAPAYVLWRAAGPRRHAMNVKDIDVSAHRKADHPIEPGFWGRWSPRAMSGEAVTPAELARLFEAARWAPSSFNEQPWRFIYAHRGTAHFDRLFALLVDANKAWAKSAGVLIVMVSKRTFSHNGSPNPVHVFDAGAAWQNLALQGSTLGLVVHGMAGFDADRARRDLGVPDDFSVAAMIAVGRPGPVQDLPQALREREVPSGRRPIAESASEGAFRK